jgi:hypothetical protein
MEFVRCVRSPDFGYVILSKALQYFNTLKPTTMLQRTVEQTCALSRLDGR